MTIGSSGWSPWNRGDVGRSRFGEDLIRVNLANIGDPVWITIGSSARGYAEEYLRWVERERLALQSDPLISRKSSKQPIRLWRHPFVGTVGCVQDINQIALVQVTTYQGPESSLEIPLLDDDGVPLLDPSRWGLISSRWAILDIQGADPDKISTTWDHRTTWVDHHCQMRPSSQWHRFSNLSTAAYLRLARDPIPHLVLVVNVGAVRDNRNEDPYYAPYPYMRLIHILGTAGNSRAKTNREVGATDEEGHHLIKTAFLDWGESPAAAGAFSPFWESDGDRERLQMTDVQMGNWAVDSVAQGSTQQIWLTDNGLGPSTGGGRKTFTSLGGFVPCVRVRAISLPGASATLATPSTWVADTRHKNMVAKPSGSGDAVLNAPAMELANYLSVLRWGRNPTGTDPDDYWNINITNASIIAGRNRGYVAQAYGMGGTA